MSLVPFTSPRRTTPRLSSATQTHAAYPFASPNGGLDLTQPLPGGDPSFAARLENLIPRVWGCEMRAGYFRWCYGAGGEVRTLMSYFPPSAAGGTRLFAGISTGDVFDVTAPTDLSSVPPEFTTTDGDVDGEWYWVNYSNTAGNFLLMVCAGAGYWAFDGSTWTQITEGTATGQIEGINPDQFSYIFVWKNRIWFLQRDTSRAWYLPIGQIAGKATEFDFGPLLPHGGSLQVGVNWTMDGGDGMDDNLVLISSQGDVLVYKGTDPDEASTFSVVGLCYIGRVPGGRRFTSQYSSDLAIVCERGVVFMSELMRGQGFFQNATLALRVNTELARRVSESLRNPYWEVRYLPEVQLIIVNTPVRAGSQLQWGFEVNAKSWFNISGMPMVTILPFDGQTFFGDLNGNVWRAFSGDSDGAVDGEPGKDLEGVCLTMFQPLGEGMRKKRFLMAKPSFIASTAPSVKVAMNSQWDFGAPTSAPSYSKGGDALWDVGLWDQTYWSGAQNTYEAWVGVTGLGNYGALALRVRGRAGTIFASWTALVEQGGIL